MEFDRIHRLIASSIDQALFPGAVVRIEKGNEVLFNEAYGHSSVFDEHKKMDTNTIFDIASLTKLVTTTTILQLVEDRNILLEDNLLEVLPVLKEDLNLERYFSSVTIKQLLTHSSGLIDWVPFYCRKTPFYDQLSLIVSSADRREGVCYSDLNFMLLREVIEERSGFSMKEAVDRYIRQPLSMETMIFGPVSGGNVASTELGNRIEMDMCKQRNLDYENWRELAKPITGEVNDGNAFYYFQGVSGHAGLFANALDVSKIGQLYANKGMREGNQLISPELVEMATSRLVGNRGLGFEFSPIFPEGFGHTGFTGTSLWIVPEKQLIVTVLTNRLHMNNPKNIQSFRKELHDQMIQSNF